jgi:hypothetical protein
MSTNDFLVLAPGTDEPGGATLATRLVWALNDRANLKLRGRSGLQFAAGYYAALDETGGSLTAKELIGRTTQALAAARRGDPGSGTILGFHPA